MPSSSHCLLFFFYCYGDPRDLHSFPTRRSSDLHARRLAQDIARLVRRDRIFELDIHRLRMADEDWHPHAGGEDRKSTRLNSSHQIISYAVFCLKKKKILHPERQRRLYKLPLSLE